jgi:hypothetical protein
MLRVTRIWLPLGIALAGVVLIVIGGGRVRGGTVTGDTLAGAGVALLGVALIVWMINWMYRMSLQSNREREDEEEARKHFDRTGQWPGE